MLSSNPPTPPPPPAPVSAFSGITFNSSMPKRYLRISFNFLVAPPTAPLASFMDSSTVLPRFPAVFASFGATYPINLAIKLNTLVSKIAIAFKYGNTLANTGKNILPNALVIVTTLSLRILIWLAGSSIVLAKSPCESAVCFIITAYLRAIFSPCDIFLTDLVIPCAMASALIAASVTSIPYL